MQSALSVNGSKAAPETSTTHTNVVGILDTSLHSLSLKDQQNSPPETAQRTESPKRPALVHSYTGNDPYILDLLQKYYDESFFIDGPDYLKAVPLPPSPQPLKSNSQRPQAWRPDGTMIAHFTEHQARINRVVVSPDHNFFITCSDDGTVKVWDSIRLEKKVVNRARLTYRHEGTGVKVKSICFIDDTHCFASASDDGNIRIVKVHYGRGPLMPVYGKLEEVGKTTLEQGEYAMWMESFRQDHRVLLLLATNLSRILALDLRTMETVFALQNPPHHGTPTCFCVDRSKHIWLLVGTSRGILDLWDLRFLLRLKAWGLPPFNSIKRLQIHPTRGHGKWVCVAGGASHGEITTWDIDKLQCREVYRTNNARDVPHAYEAYRIDDDKPEGPLGRFSVETELRLDSGVHYGIERGFNAIVVGKDVRTEGSSEKSGTGFIVSGGMDRTIRFWDLGKPELSCVVSGLDVDEGKPSFASVQVSPSLSMTVEKKSLSVASNQKERSSKKRAGQQPSRQAFISLQQEKLLKNHLDAITDVALLEFPFAMIISVDRAGCMNVFA